MSHELINIIMRSRNTDQYEAEKFIEKHAETVKDYREMGFSDQWIYDVINDEL